jgi:hypothetical protein
VIVATTALVFTALGIHIATGGAFEVRTVAAMTLRTVFGRQSQCLPGAACCEIRGRPRDESVSCASLPSATSKSL